jgi:hypothetical protein
MSAAWRRADGVDEEAAWERERSKGGWQGREEERGQTEKKHRARTKKAR